MMKTQSYNLNTDSAKKNKMSSISYKTAMIWKKSWQNLAADKALDVLLWLFRWNVYASNLSFLFL